MPKKDSAKDKIFADAAKIAKEMTGASTVKKKTSPAVSSHAKKAASPVEEAKDCSVKKKGAERLAAIKTAEKNGLQRSWSIVAKDRFAEAFTFSDNGLSNVKYYASSEIGPSFKYGFITKNMDIVHGGYDRVGDFSEGLAAVSLDPYRDESRKDYSRYGRFGYINEKFELVIPHKFLRATMFKNGAAFVGVPAGMLARFLEEIDPKKRLGYKGDDLIYGYIDKSGEYLIKPKYKGCFMFGDNGLALASMDGKLLGIINKAGEWVVGPKFSYGYNFFGGACPVKDKSGLWGLIDSEGKWIIEPVYEEIGACYNNTSVRAKKGGKWRYIDSCGNIVCLMPDNVTDIGTSLTNGIASAKTHSWGVIDTDGKWIVKPQFADMRSPAENGFIAVRWHALSASDHNNWGYIQVSI